MTTANLIKLLEELNTFRNKDRNQIIREAIQSRLDKSLKEYYDDLNKSLDRLEYYNEQNNLKLIKKINKEY